jgi:hypothetical protein
MMLTVIHPKVSPDQQEQIANIGNPAHQIIGHDLEIRPDAQQQRSQDDAVQRPERVVGHDHERTGLRPCGQRVLVVTQPYLSDLHVDQQRALESSLQRQFGSDSGVRYVNLGRLVDLRDPGRAYDGLHLTAIGNQKVAAALAPAVLEMMR